MLEIAGKLLDASSHWPLTFQILLVAIVVPASIYAWRSGALNRDRDDHHEEDDASEGRRRIYNHIDLVVGPLEDRLRDAENRLTEHRVRLEHLEAPRRR